MPHSNCICPCGNSPSFKTTTILGIDRTQSEGFVLTSFGAHLVSHLKGKNEFDHFKGSVSRYIEITNKNRHKVKQEESPESLLRSITILQRTCEKIGSKDTTYLNNYIDYFKADDADSLDRLDVERAYNRINQVVDFLKEAKQLIKRDDNWQCSIQ